MRIRTRLKFIGAMGERRIEYLPDHWGEEIKNDCIDYYRKKGYGWVQTKDYYNYEDVMRSV